MTRTLGKKQRKRPKTDRSAAARARAPDALASEQPPATDRSVTALAPYRPNTAARILLDIHSAVTGIRVRRTGLELDLLRRWYDATQEYLHLFPRVVCAYVASRVPNLDDFLVVFFQRTNNRRVEWAEVFRKGSGQPLLLDIPNGERILGDDVRQDGWEIVLPATTEELVAVAADPALALLWREDDRRSRDDGKRIQKRYDSNPPRIGERADVVVDVVARLTIPREVRDDNVADPALRSARIRINRHKSSFPTVWPDVGATIAEITHHLRAMFPGIPENDIFVAIDFAMNDGRIALREGSEGSFGRTPSTCRTGKFFCNDAIWVVSTQKGRLADGADKPIAEKTPITLVAEPETGASTRGREKKRWTKAEVNVAVREYLERISSATLRNLEGRIKKGETRAKAEARKLVGRNVIARALGCSGAHVSQSPAWIAVAEKLGARGRTPGGRTGKKIGLEQAVEADAEQKWMELAREQKAEVEADERARPKRRNRV